MLNYIPPLHARTTSRRSTINLLLTVAIVIVAVALRLHIFAADRSLWHDEAMIAINIIYRPIEELLGALYFDQVAPAAWLASQKLISEWWSDFDFSLRATALLASLAALVAMDRFAARALTPTERLVTLALFALSPALIAYSAMVKPYAWDVLFSAVLMMLAYQLIATEGGRLWRVGVFALVGALGVVSSFGAIFVLAPFGLTVFAHAVLTRQWRLAGAYVAVGLAWVAVAAATYVAIYADNAATISNMREDLWVSAFAPLPPTSIEEVLWYSRAALLFFDFLDLGVDPKIALLAGFVGCVALLFGRIWLLALCLGPIATAVLLSGLHLYPFASRVSLYLAPQFIVLVALGVVAPARLVRPCALVAAGLTGLVALPAVVEIVREATSSPPWAVEEIKPNIALYAERSVPDDILFVNIAAERPLLIYAPAYGIADHDHIVGVSLRNKPECADLDIARLLNADRSFVLLYHPTVGNAAGTERLLAGLAARGTLDVLGEQRGSSLYEFRPDPDARPPSVENLGSCDQQRPAAEFLARVAAENRTSKIHY